MTLRAFLRRHDFVRVLFPFGSDETCYPLLLGEMFKNLFDGPAFQRDLLQDDPGQVIEWWESRRWLFNAVVGCTGIITCVAMVACAWFAEPTVGEAIGLPDPVFLGIFGIILFGFWPTSVTRAAGLSSYY